MNVFFSGLALRISQFLQTSRIHVKLTGDFWKMQTNQHLLINLNAAKALCIALWNLPNAGHNQPAVFFLRHPHRRVSLLAWPDGTPSVTSGYDLRSHHLCSHWEKQKMPNKTHVHTHLTPGTHMSAHTELPHLRQTD